MPLDDAAPADPILGLAFDTRALPAADGFAMWRSILGEFYDVAAPDEAPFRAAMTAWNLGGVLVSAGQFSAQEFSRNARRVRRDGFDHYTVLLHRRGRFMADTGSHVARSGPGGLCVLDFARPVVTRTSPNDLVTITFPRDMLDRVLPPRDLHGLTLAGAPAGLLQDFLLALAQRLPTLRAGDAPHLAAACGNLLAACVAPSAATAERAQAPLEALTYRRARRLIDAHMHLPDWDAEALRLALGMSRASLYRVFARFGGVAAHIRQRRLARAHALLAAAEGRGLVSQVAAQCGFVSDAHFSRAFRAAYGYSPREAMAAPGAGPPPPRPRQGDEARFVDWIRRLSA